MIPNAGGGKRAKRKYQDYGGTPCPYCGQPMNKRREEPECNPRNITRDHIIPKCKGGSHVLCMFVCHQCNNDKGGLLLEEWVEKLEADGDPRAELVRSILF